MWGSRCGARLVEKTPKNGVCGAGAAAKAQKTLLVGEIDSNWSIFSKNGKREPCCVEKRQSCGKPCGNCVKLLIYRALAILCAAIFAAKNQVFPQNGRFAKNKKFRFFQSAKIAAFSRPILDRRDTLVYNNIVCCIHQ